MFDLHRHDEFSTFDGFGKATELAKIAKEKGYKALSTTNHGNTNGLIRTYNACKSEGIKPILGVEGYFLPVYKEKTRGYHLVVIAKNLEGYGNLNRLQYHGEKQKYYNPIWDFEGLKKYHEGLICCSACVASYSAQAIIKNRNDLAEKYFRKMQNVFGEDFYIEIQPYAISDEGVQEKVNVESIKLAEKLGIKCILTSDSHRGKKEDFEAYKKMHEIAGHDSFDIEATYKDRYMPEYDEMAKRFVKMHAVDFGKKTCISMAKSMYKNLDSIENKCKDNYLDDLQLKLPKVDVGADKTSFEVLAEKVRYGLKNRGKNCKKYIERAKEELDIIKFHGFEDYFLIVADYVNWAKEQGIAVGPGRGSVCNSIVAYALKITDVDSILLDLDFCRFLRKDKKKFPDIDLDFQTSRRGEVIAYLCEKYKGHAARICSYGLYKVDNLVNDLAKVCGLPTDKTVDAEEVKENKRQIAGIKSICRMYIDESGTLSTEKLLDDVDAKRYDEQYQNIVTLFSKMFEKVRYIGTHAAGVAITGGNILDYVALRKDKNGEIYTAYDLEDSESVNVIKFDILGLKTMESISDLRECTGVCADYDRLIGDDKIYEQFRLGNTDGVFQLEKNTAKEILAGIDCDCFNDVIAATSMNRPGPLKTGMPETYADNKHNIENAKNSKYWEYTKDSYGAIIYQEQLQKICVNIGLLSWADADKMMKVMKHGEENARSQLQTMKENGDDLKGKFIKGALKSGLTKSEANELFSNMLVYSFVKGHGAGYSLISVEEMFYKLNFSTEFWFCKLKYAKDISETSKFCECAVKNDVVIFLPHVNYSVSKTSLRKESGENVIQQGLSDLKNVGEKAAKEIVDERNENGIFRSFDDFYDRCKSRLVTSRVVDVLKEQGALEFDKKVYINRVVKFNSAMYARNGR